MTKPKAEAEVEAVVAVVVAASQCDSGPAPCSQVALGHTQHMRSLRARNSHKGASSHRISSCDHDRCDSQSWCDW